MRRRHRVVAVDPLAPLSLEALNREADKRTAALIRSLRLPVLQERSRLGRESAADTGAIRYAGEAASHLLQQGAERAGEAARKAGTQISSLAGSLTNDERSRALAAQALAGGVAGTYDPTSITHTGLVAGGSIPSEQFLTHGLASRIEAEAQPGIQGRVTQMAIEEALRRHGEQDTALGQKLLEISNKRPELRGQILDALRSFEIKKRAQSLYEQQFGFKQQQWNQTYSLKRDQYNLAVSKHQFAIDQAASQGRKPSASLSRAYGHIVDENGEPILDANGNQIPVVASNKGSGSTYRQGVQEARRILGDPIKNDTVTSVTPGRFLARQGAKGGDVFPGRGTLPATTNNPRKAQRDSAYNSFVEAQAYLMQAYGMTKPQARKALIAAGWKPDGQRPRKKTRVQ